jgi:hypothetical protein
MVEDGMIKIFLRLLQAFRKHMAHLESGMAMLDDLDKSYKRHNLWHR